MSVYTLDHRVSNAEVSPYRLLRPSALMELLQEVSVRHSEELSVGRERTLDRGILWVMVMQDTEIIRMPAYEDSIAISTWPGKTRHSLFPRFYQVCGQSGEQLVRASALWTLVDTETRKIVSADEYGIVVPEETDMPSWAPPDPVVCADTAETYEVSVPYSYLDMNGHMSNVRYFDVAEDHISEAAQGMVPARLGAEYISELTYGDKFELEVGTDGQARTFMGRSSEKIYFKLRMEYRQQ